jgi:hypothetical protein
MVQPSARAFAAGSKIPKAICFLVLPVTNWVQHAPQPVNGCGSIFPNGLGFFCPLSLGILPGPERLRLGEHELSNGGKTAHLAGTCIEKLLHSFNDF